MDVGSFILIASVFSVVLIGILAFAVVLAGEGRPRGMPKITKSTNLQMAFDDGYRSFKEGKDKSMNPFARTDLRCEWFEGWEKAHDVILLDRLRESTQKPFSTNRPGWIEPCLDPPPHPPVPQSPPKGP